ncbi:hypothetical protein ASD65_00305 [Microbacterium sp. Root61]|uniref:PilW family protein n=1 Tax=Microbacterium sp. Root61 TaxID=1736570 RepID=UPI0006F4AF7C|nr:hypothetical protein [Microbacterium sp. Root61]KRA23031.1 hypothetical protein ASD65_00305 [Microbacterium sp. Root61]
MTASLRERVGSDESGLTLIELVIYMTLAVVVGTIVVSMFIGTLKGQDQVTSTTQATTKGQLAATTIERAMRNATAFAIADGGKTLTVLTTLDKPCQQFTLQRNAAASTGSRDVYDLFLYQGAKLPVGTWPTASTGALTSGVVLVDADHHTSIPFVLDGKSLDYTLWFATDVKASAPDSPNVDFRGTITPRGTGGVIASCS